MTAISNTAYKRQGMALAKKLLAFVLTLVLCVSFVPAAPAVAADDAQENTVTLTIVKGSAIGGQVSYDTLVNKEYEFKDGDTVKNLLDYAVEEGDIKAYEAPDTGYGMALSSVTSKDGETTVNYQDPSTAYWGSWWNKQYAQTTMENEALAAGGSYQFAWVSYEPLIPTHYDWDLYYEDNPLEVSDGEVGLTIEKGRVDYSAQLIADPWVNKSYKLADIAGFSKKDESDLTVEDLLDYAVDRKDIQEYSAPLSYGANYLKSITSSAGDEVTNDADYTGYWGSWWNKAYASTGVDQEPLADGHSYQFAWIAGKCSVPTYYDWDAYYEENTPGDSTNTPGGSEGSDTPSDRPPSDYVATGVDIDQVGALMDNIAKSYAGTTDPWKVLGLSALDMKGSIGSDFVEKAVNEIKNPTADGATAVQRYIIALSAAGYDATALPDGNGTFNAVEKMAQDVTSSNSANALIATLWAYESGDYEVPDNAKLSEDDLVDAILKNQVEGGGFSYGGSEIDIDTTAMAIVALAPYENENPEAKEAISKALYALQGQQLDNGGFSNSWGDASSGSTAYVIMALCATGINPATDWATKDGSTPLSALLSFATKDMAGFVADDSSTRINEMATEQGFMALVAYQGLVDSENGSYNLITQARYGGSSIPDYTKTEKEGSDSDPADEGDATQTGDNSVSTLALAALIAMLATFIAGSAAHRRRMNMTNGKEG